MHRQGSGRICYKPAPTNRRCCVLANMHQPVIVRMQFKSLARVFCMQTGFRRKHRHYPSNKHIRIDDLVYNCDGFSVGPGLIRGDASIASSSQLAGSLNHRRRAGCPRMFHHYGFVDKVISSRLPVVPICSSCTTGHSIGQCTLYEPELRHAKTTLIRNTMF